MAYLKSYTVLLRHRKLIQFANDLRLNPVYAMGHLHALWHETLEQQEDGDLSKWSDTFLSSSAAYPGDAPQFVRLLRKNGWLEESGLLHDWLDYAGDYLRGKYRTRNRERLLAIWAKHGRVYGSEEDKKKEKEGESSYSNKTVTVPEQLGADRQIRQTDRPHGRAEAPKTANGARSGRWQPCRKCRQNGRFETATMRDGATPCCPNCREQEDIASGDL